MIPFLTQYLVDREEMLKKKEIQSESLFPSSSGRAYSIQAFHKIKKKIEEVTGKIILHKGLQKL